MMQAAPKLGLLLVLEGCHAEFQCGVAGDGAVHVGGGERVAADDEAVHGVAKK